MLRCVLARRSPYLQVLSRASLRAASPATRSLRHPFRRAASAGPPCALPVHYKPQAAESLSPVPGIALGTAPARIKNWDRDDVVLVVADPGSVAAGVYTQNRFCAAPVIVSRAHLAAQRERRLDFRALVINAGNANAGTGESGLAGARASCAEAARLTGGAPEQ